MEEMCMCQVSSEYMLLYQLKSNFLLQLDFTHPFKQQVFSFNNSLQRFVFFCGDDDTNTRATTTTNVTTITSTTTITTTTAPTTNMLLNRVAEAVLLGEVVVFLKQPMQEHNVGFVCVLCVLCCASVYVVSCICCISVFFVSYVVYFVLFFFIKR